MQHLEMPDWFLRLTVPGHQKFAETVRGVTAFVAGEARLPRDEALKLGQAVDWVAERGLMASAGEGRGIEVWFEKRAGALEIGMRYADLDSSTGGVAGLREDTQRGWEHLSRLMNRVEVSREADLVLCRMSCRLPGS
jgi:hypothetical protein